MTLFLVTSLPVTPLSVTSNPVTILLLVMRNDTFYTNTIVRKMRGQMTSLPVPSLPVTWLPVMSHALAMLIPAMSNGTFRTTTMVKKKKRECTSGHVQNILPVMTSLPVTWFHVTSFPVRAVSGHVTSSISYAMARSTLLPRNMPWAVSIYYFDIWIWGTLWITRVFNWLKCLGGVMHLKPTVGCQISTLIFYFFLWRGSL
jgi:hypothetical protein